MHILMPRITAEQLAPRDSISTMQLRQQLGEVLERVYYQFQQFRVLRKDKPMARLVNEEYMQAIDYLIESDPALADTIALMLNDEATDILKHGKQEWSSGERIPLEEALR